MRGTVVGVLRGGPSREHDVSLATGHAMLFHLPPDRFTVRDIYIDRKGNWHERGKPTTPAQILPSVDVVCNGLHGEYGEDGTVQRLLEQYGVPFTGSDSFGSYLAMHKVLSKEKAHEMGIKTPRYYFVEEGADIDAIASEANRKFFPPVVVKPVKWGSSVGISVVHGFAPIRDAVRTLLPEAGGVIIEEYVRGREATVGVVEDLRSEPLYALPPIEIIPSQHHGFFSYDAKYGGETKEICPSRFPKATIDELQRIARTMHEALGLRHYSRTDLVVSPRGVYYLETNTLPGMTSESLLPKSLLAVGVKFKDFLSHIIDLALRKRT